MIFGRTCHCPLAIECQSRCWHLRAQALVTARPEAATALAMQLCSPAAGAGADAAYVAAASDFAHIYADRCA